MTTVCLKFSVNPDWCLLIEHNDPLQLFHDYTERQPKVKLVHLCMKSNLFENRFNVCQCNTLSKVTIVFPSLQLKDKL